MKLKTFYKRYLSLKGKLSAAAQQIKMAEHTFIILLAILIGVLAGLGAVGIRWLIKTVSAISFTGSGNVYENILHTPWYWIIIIPVIGGAIVGPIIYFLAPEAKGHGVPEVMQAILLKSGRIRPRVAFIKTIASAITIGTGGSVGREGPIIQIGSSLGSTIGQFVHIHPNKLKTLVGCGAAAGIAAAFNAPIAGALFAVEIILMDFAVAQFSPIVISSVMATVVSRFFEGNFAAFTVPAYQLVSPIEIFFYFILGTLCGIISFAFIKVLYYSEDVFDNKIKIPEYYKPAIGGLIIGTTALIFPQIMGLGYETVNLALKGEMLWYLALILIFIKIFATSVTLGSGGSGGIFTPSLFMGAMVGYFFGTFVHSYFPEITGSPNAYALVAMGGLVAGATRAPITAIIIVFEMTNDYNIILPLMVTCIISTIISSKFSAESIYTLKLLMRNINIKEGTDENIMASVSIKDVYSREFTPILVNDNFFKIIDQIIKSKSIDFPVMNKKSEICGMISIMDVKENLSEGEALQNILIAGDILRIDFEMIDEESDGKTAMQLLSKYDYEGLPVCNKQNPRKVIGMLWRKDLHDAYMRESQTRELSTNLASSIIMKTPNQQVHFWDGYSVIEMVPPKAFLNKSIRELNIRANYGVSVLSIKTSENGFVKVSAIPNPDHLIKEGDILVIAGENKYISVLKNLD